MIKLMRTEAIEDLGHQPTSYPEKIKGLPRRLRSRVGLRLQDQLISMNPTVLRRKLTLSSKNSKMK